MKITARTCFKIGLTLFLLFLACTYWPTLVHVVQLFLGTLSPLLIGFAIAYIVNILMSTYERWYFPYSRRKFVRKSRRIVCMTLAYISFIGIVVLVAWLIIPQLARCIETLLVQVPVVFNQLLEIVEEWNILPQETIDSLKNISWTTTIQEIIRAFGSGWNNMLNTMIDTVKAVFSTAVTALLSFIFSLYFLLGKDSLRHGIVRVMDHYMDHKITEKVRNFAGLLHDCFRRFIIGQCTEAVILGVLCTVGMWILRFPYAPMIGALIAFTALIPIAGAYIGAFVGAFMIFTVEPLQALFFLIFIVVLQQLEGNLIYPHVVGSSIGLPGLWVLVAVTIGGGIAGVLGMLCGVPLAAALYRLIKDDLGRDRPQNRKLRFGKKKAVPAEGDTPPEEGTTPAVDGDVPAKEQPVVATE